jgi:hypothetical protein
MSDSVDPAAQSAPSTVQAPALAPVKPADVNPRLTNVNIKIKNSDALSKLKDKFKNLNVHGNATQPRPDNDWLKRLDIDSNSESAHSAQHIIDVQPDQRYPFSYFVYFLTRLFPSLEVKSHPSVSLFTMLSYIQICFNAYILMQEDICRPVKSLWCQQFNNDAERRDYFHFIQTLQIPTEIADIILNLASVLDPSRPDCFFIPSYAGGAFMHDFGRLMPPQIGITMHNLLANTRTNVTVNEVLRQLYNTLLITLNQIPFYVTNFIGGQFQNAQAVNNYDHWLRDLIESFFSPAVGRTHIQRPTLAPVRRTPYAYEANVLNPNLYDFMLNFNQADYQSTRSTLGAISSFIVGNTAIPSIPLGSILVNAGGITTMSHTVESICLPTWHTLAPPTTTLSATANAVTLSDTDMATLTNFLIEQPEYESTAPFPATLTAAQWNENLYMIHNAAYRRNHPPYETILFDSDMHIHPDVFIFQPYERSLERANVSTTLGLKIQSDEIDSSILPLPNIEDSLYRNNSVYYTGSLPLTKVKPVMFNTTANAHTYLIGREIESYTINGLSIRDGGRNVLPVFANANVAPNIVLPRFFAREQNHCNPNLAATYAAWRTTGACPIPDNSRTVWSSYRIVDNSNKQNRLVHFYYSFRPMFGNSVPLYRTRNPSILIPKP